jgi:GNAT superfamily N-acetyltransferase
MPIRRAEPSDGQVVARLIRELAEYEHLAHEVVWVEAALQEELFGDGAVPSVLLAESDEGEVAGFALYFESFSTFLGTSGLWLEDLYVRPEHRGAGHGRALLDALCGLTSGRVEWNVLTWNTAAVGFYDSLGARPVEGWVTYRWLPGALSHGVDTGPGAFGA